jgi:hypothetical protein
MKCKRCKHWQGTKYSEWGDCYRVILALNPELETCFISNEHGTVTRNFQVPFDPHDIKYWMEPGFKAIYDNMKTENMAVLGVKVVETITDDIIYDRDNGERVGKLKIKYFQIHKEYECND